MANRLSLQKSRYLRQHEKNPVAWLPWGEESFLKASAEGKPLFVSIGYSSCHWCHVMAHDCFEDPEVAAFLNGHFVPVKVDKEEYPDVDGFYMEYLSRLTGRGGWPLNVFTNASGVPIYAISYLPAEQFLDLLQQVDREYRKKQDLQEERLSAGFTLKAPPAGEIPNLLSKLKTKPVATSRGPQFPQALFLSLALDEGYTDEVAGQLEQLVTRGLFDHVEGGWFRYTVDGEWKIPHFEKMLYDQGTLLLLAAEGYTMNKELCDYAIRKTVGWLEDHMRIPGGLFGSATDADTGEGEGTYYTIEEPGDGISRELFRIDECGVHEGRFQPWFSFDAVHRDPVGAERAIEAELLSRRDREFPGLDRKAVVSWNAFLGYALYRCAEKLGEASMAAIADRIREALAGSFRDGRLHHVIYEGEPFLSHEYLEDYSAYLLMLSAASKDRPELRDEAAGLVSRIEERFLEGDRIYHTTVREYENLGLRQDSPFPAGGSMLLHALIGLDSPALTRYAGLFSGILPIAKENPMFFPFWISAYRRIYL